MWLKKRYFKEAEPNGKKMAPKTKGQGTCWSRNRVELFSAFHTGEIEVCIHIFLEKE